METRKTKLHVLKLQNEYFDAVMSGNKSAELRIDDGRDFRCGDLIHFTDVDGYEFPYNATRDCLDKTNLFVITHVLDVSKVLGKMKAMYVMLSIKRL